jgi:hypothetical protein
MKSAKVKLLESTFIGYTGILCGIQFEDGISVKEVVDQQRICASMRAETIEGRNDASGQFSERHNVSLEDAANEPKAPDVAPMQRGVVEPEAPKFTREELESLADEQGSPVCV